MTDAFAPAEVAKFDRDAAPRGVKLQLDPGVRIGAFMPVARVNTTRPRSG